MLYDESFDERKDGYSGEAAFRWDDYVIFLQKSAHNMQYNSKIRQSRHHPTNTAKTSKPQRPSFIAHTAKRSISCGVTFAEDLEITYFIDSCHNPSEVTNSESAYQDSNECSVSNLQMDIIHINGSNCEIKETDGPMVDGFVQQPRPE